MDNPPAEAWSSYSLHIIETGNESFRFKHSSATAKARIRTREKSQRASPTEETAAS
jgi:hypothetical protein